MAGPACLVFDDELTAYDFGPAHPMAPVRVELTIRLAHELGILERLEVVPAPVADDEQLGLVHTMDYIDAVKKTSADPGQHDLAARLGHRRQPDVRAHARGLGSHRRCDARGNPAGVGGRGAARHQRQRRAPPCDGRRGERLLHLQRPGDRDRVAAGGGRRTGRLRRHRRAPRRRRAGGVLRRPARADDQPAREPPDTVPRHGRRLGERWPRGRGHVGQRRHAAGHGRRWVAARVPCRRTPVAARLRADGAGEPARVRLAHGRPARPPDALGRRSARRAPRAARPGPRGVRGTLDLDRWRWVCRGRRGPAHLEPPARRGLRGAGRSRDADPRGVAAVRRGAHRSPRAAVDDRRSDAGVRELGRRVQPRLVAGPLHRTDPPRRLPGPRPHPRPVSTWSRYSPISD